MSYRLSTVLLLGGVLGVFIGAAMAIVASGGANAAGCDPCIRPLIWDLAYLGGEVLFILALVDIIAVGVWRSRHRRR